MPNELIGHLRGLPSTVRARLHKGVQTWNVSTGAWVNFSAGNWAQYLVTMASDTGTGIYFGDLPTAAADAEYVTYYEGTSLGIVRAWQILRLGGPFAATGITGQTMRAIIKNGLLTWRRTTSAWVTHNDADWADYLITMTEDAGTGVYSAALPAGAEAWTHIRHHNGLSVGEADLVQFRNTAAPVPDTVALPATAFWWSPSRIEETRNQPTVFYPGGGRSLSFRRYGGDATSDGSYELRVTEWRSSTVLFTTVGSIFTDTGRITVNPTATQTTGMTRGKVYIGELWRTDGDDNTDAVASILIRVPYR